MVLSRMGEWEAGADPSFGIESNRIESDRVELSGVGVLYWRSRCVAFGVPESVG
jgi:hypothetical protein